MNQQLPVQMHPKYPEFLAFMTECPHRKTPSTMETAFWAWLKAQSSDSQDVRDLAIFSSEQAIEIKILKNDLDRLHRERDSFQQQSSAMASENERLSDELMRIKRNIAGFLHGGAVGERGHACMSIDNGNL